MSARDRVREFASGFDATEFASKLRGVLNGEPWFEKRGADRIRRRPVDDDQRRRHRRYQRYLGAGFLVLLGVALWWPTVAAVGVIGCASAAIGVATVRGRYYCDWLCPRGGLLDGYVRLLSRGKRTPTWFKHPLIRAGVAVAAFGALGAGLVAAWGNPAAMAVPFLTMLGVSTLVAASLGVVYHQRAWCQICPAGTIAHAVHRVAEALGRDPAPRVAVDADACLSCGRCGTVCRQEIRPGKYGDGEVTDHGNVLSPGGSDGRTRSADGVVDHGDCLQCAACVEECPVDALAIEE
jgi:ferredoxin